jgi:hypothetical protein
VRDWYVESFQELRTFPGVGDMDAEGAFTDLLRHIYRRHVRDLGGDLGWYLGTAIGCPLRKGVLLHSTPSSPTPPLPNH